MSRVMSASRRVRKTGAVPVLGLTRAKSSGASGKQRSASAMVLVSWRKKAHAVASNCRCAPPKMRAQNLKRESTSGKNGGRSVPRRRFSKVVQPGDAAAGGNGLEEFCRGLVGVDAGRGEQADQTLGLDQAHGALHEERIEVYVAAAQQWIVAGGPHQPAQMLSARCFGVIEISGQRIALRTQFANGGSARRRRGGAGEFRRAGGEPLHFLQLDAVPGRVADHGVESAARVGVLPLFPHPGKGRFPVQKGLAVGDGSGVVPEGGEFGSAALHVVRRWRFVPLAGRRLQTCATGR